MNKVSDITDLLQAGIQAESLQQQAISSNVANLNTPRYRTVEVVFEDALAKAMNADGTVRADQFEPEIVESHSTPVKADGNDVNLENEIGKMIENSLKHSTYIRLLRQKYNQVDLAIKI